MKYIPSRMVCYWSPVYNVYSRVIIIKMSKTVYNSFTKKKKKIQLDQTANRWRSENYEILSRPFPHPQNPFWPCG
jgi:hypothetical protein